MSNFQIWEQQNLARFAQEANEKLLAQQKEIEQLRATAVVREAVIDDLTSKLNDSLQRVQVPPSF